MYMSSCDLGSLPIFLLTNTCGLASEIGVYLLDKQLSIFLNPKRLPMSQKILYANIFYVKWLLHENCEYFIETDSERGVTNMFTTSLFSRFKILT